MRVFGGEFSACVELAGVNWITFLTDLVEIRSAAVCLRRKRVAGLLLVLLRFSAHRIRAHIPGAVIAQHPGFNI